MESVKNETLKELLRKNPNATVEEFLDLLNEKYKEYIEACFNREVSVVLKAYKESVRNLVKVINVT